jgi:hypothetical protein
MHGGNVIEKFINNVQHLKNQNLFIILEAYEP